ncbi:MAG: N-acetylmuramoyl-L-alanine amidase [Saprospiraceae bacterium]|nr:N-acetylmuramoyl-L-alanine amidase [Saprospiraceae bacterium]
MSLRKQLILWTILLIGVSIQASPKPIKSTKSSKSKKTIQYLKVKPSEGQGVYSLLRNYKLIQDPDNVALFYEINSLKQNTSLSKNKLYKLPIEVLKYDGKSIRTSIGNKNLETAKQIEEYNLVLTKKKIRKTDYKKDGKLWVPIQINEKSNNQLANSSKIILSNSSTTQSVKSIPEDDPRKQFLVASMSTMKSKLVADYKMTDAEVNSLRERFTSLKSEGNLIKKVSAKSLNVPLFGNKYESVDIVTDELNDQVFYIVPGHGGPDPGAIAKNVDVKYTICEDEYAYDVSLRLAKNLMEKGATVYIIVEDKKDGIRDEMYLDCDKDETSMGGHEIPLSQKKRLKQGISKVNKLYSKHKKKGIAKQWMVSLHIDAQSEESRQDVFFYYQSESTISKNKALDIQNVFEEKYKICRKNECYKGTVSSRPLYVVRNSDPEPIFVELANIHNPEDQKRILYPKNRQLLADWITEGFLK